MSYSQPSPTRDKLEIGIKNATQDQPIELMSTNQHFQVRVAAFVPPQQERVFPACCSRKFWLLHTCLLFGMLSFLLGCGAKFDPTKMSVHAAAKKIVITEEFSLGRGFPSTVVKILHQRDAITRKILGRPHIVHSNGESNILVWKCTNGELHLAFERDNFKALLAVFPNGETETLLEAEPE